MARKIDKHPANPPQTVRGADDRLPTPRTSNDPAKPVPGEPSKPDPNSRATSPPAEDANYDHPARPGDEAVVPGAGVVRADADAHPKESQAAPGDAGQARKQNGRD